MTVNTKKTKVLVFNKSGRLKNIKISLDNQYLDCVQHYTYLGVNFSASGSFLSAKKELYNKGFKALFKLRKTFSSDAPKPKTLLHIFNHTIRPILLYGSEIWGYFSPKKYKSLDSYIIKEIDSIVLEKIHTKFCKFTLGVNTKASNTASRGELGSLPILFHVLLNMVKYWCHITKEIDQSNIILYEALNLSKTMCKNNQESWVGSIKEIFKYLNLEYLFTDQHKFKSNYIIKKVKTSLVAKFNDQWFDILNNGKKNSKTGNKLRTYGKFKNTFSFEPYLTLGTKSERQIIAKFRISAHDLEIERGRYLGLKAENRTCNLCKGSVEDELHFLLKCPSLANHRQHYLDKISNNYKNFSKLSDENKFIWILSSEDKMIFNCLSKMLTSLFEERKKLLDKP